MLPVVLMGQRSSEREHSCSIDFFIFFLPVYIPKSCFDNINRIFSIFLWKNKTLRINQKIVIMLRGRGGLGVPDVYLNYLAFNARYPLIWVYDKRIDNGSWNWL